jgi:hypothetical protein
MTSYAHSQLGDGQLPSGAAGEKAGIVGRKGVIGRPRTAAKQFADRRSKFVAEGEPAYAKADAQNHRRGLHADTSPEF